MRRSSIRRFRSMGGSLSSGLLRLLVDPSGGGPGVDPNQTIQARRLWGGPDSAGPVCTSTDVLNGCLEVHRRQAQVDRSSLHRPGGAAISASLVRALTGHSTG